jgi:uncharacterized repeat protein (TIGR01451 family)
MRKKVVSSQKLIGRRAFLSVGIALAMMLLAVPGFGTPAVAEPEAVTVTKTASPDQVPRGSLVLYTALFNNTGVDTVNLNVIRDTLPSGFTFVSMGGGSDIHDLPAGTTGTIVWTGPYPVAAGGTVRLEYNVLVDAPFQLAPYYNLVAADLSTGGTISDEAGVTVQAPHITGTKTASLPQVYDRTPVNYVVTLNNDGTLSADVGPIVDTLPAHFRFVQMVLDPMGVGNPVVSGQTLTWAGPFTVAPGGAIQFTYKVLADGVGGTTYQNQVMATYGGETAGPFKASVKVLTNWTFAYVPIVAKDLNLNPPPVYRLAYDSKPGSNYEVYAINADGTDLVNVSNLTGGDSDPDWSPNGKIAWVHYAGNAEIYVANADGSNVQQLTNNDADDTEPKWSPDGTKIAFRSERDGRYEVYVMNADGSGQTRLTNESCQSTSPLWSPNGAKIAFLCGLDTAADVWVMDANGGNKVNLTSDDDQDKSIAWSPDDAYLAYVRAPIGYDTEIFKVSISSHTVTKLTNNSVDDYTPQWSPDGTKILFSTKFTTFDVAVMNTDGSNVVNLTNSAGGDYVPEWSSDGLMIAFIATRDGNNELYVMNADGSNQFRLTNTTSVHEERFDWMPFAP